MNGLLLNTPWFTHEQLMSGGNLELEMGPKPIRFGGGMLRWYGIFSSYM